MYAYMFEKDEEKKKALETTVKTETLPNYLANMEKLLVARGGKHFAGNEVVASYFLNTSRMQRSLTILEFGIVNNFGGTLIGVADSNKNKKNYLSFL